MAIAIVEVWGRQHGYTKVTREYVIKGVTDSDNPRAELVAFIPSTITVSGVTFYLSAADTDAKEVAVGIWMGTATWTLNQLEPTEFERSFDISGKTQHITTSLETRATKANEDAGFTEAEFDFKKTINVDEKGNIGGVDIVVPEQCDQISWEVTSMDATYRSKLRKLVGKINNAPFNDCERGELLLLGISGSQRNYGKWKLTARFAYSENWEDKTVGPFTVNAKYGWDLLWVHHETIKDDTIGKMVTTPALASIERVYEEGDFDDLDIPGM
jgi:hypothetical protein